MTRQMMRWLFAAMVAVLSFGASAEAAGTKKVVHHGPRHVTHASYGRSGHTATSKSAVTHKHHATGATSKNKSAAQKHVVKTKRKPSTKPR